MDLKGLVANPPQAHGAPTGRHAMGLDEEILRIVDAHVKADSRTLETGIGVSTALFAIKGAQHTCVAPFAAEIQRITSWCQETGVSAARVTFHEARSEDLLPKLDPTPLDLVLIDGGHGFPSPFIDWFYAGRRLAPGGILIVDDTNLWTGHVLKSFLREQPGWEMIASVPLRTAVFRRSSQKEPVQDWVHQPFVVRRSWAGGTRGRLRSAVRLGHLIRTGDWGQVRSRLARRRA